MSRHRTIVVAVVVLAVVLFAWARAGSIRQTPGPRPAVVSTQDPGRPSP
ncbi:MAG TPA: hypothetical protein VK646_04515 [Actinomycetota bacterium]|nr:hypothetical protein [Actinomycetota bacterium]